nr:nitrogen assimilation regulatory protein nac-like [Nerophis lumbriciformis]
MDLRQLRYFLVVSDQGSFTQAAERIPIAQSALSRHMRLLEEELGVQLLIRTGRGVTMTEQGEFLYERARSVLAQLEDTRRNLQSWYDNPAGVVRIGMPPSTTLVMAAMLLERMKTQHPDITVRLTEGLSATLSEWLAEDRLDLAVVYEPPGNTSLSAHRIGSEELCLVINNNDDDIPDPVSIKQMSTLKLIAPFEKKGIRNRMAEVFKEAGVEFELAFELDALPAMKDLVRAGAGTAILTRSSVVRDVQRGILKARHIDSEGMMFDVHLVYSRSSQHSRAARAAGAVIEQSAPEFFTQ